MTYKEIKKNEEVLAYLKKGNDNLGTMGFTDHSDAHCAMVAERAAMILKKFGYSDHDIELVKIAGFMHDMGMRSTGMPMRSMVPSGIPDPGKDGSSDHRPRDHRLSDRKP